MPVTTVLPCQAMGRGKPTFTESKRAMAIILQVVASQYRRRRMKVQSMR
jgi:hypothetical protein